MYEQLPTFVREPNPGIYLGDSYVVVDFETTNREHGSALDGGNSLLLACWRVGRSHPAAERGLDRTIWADEFNQSQLMCDIEQSSFVIAHNFKFEAGWLKRCGIDLRQVLSFDTMIAEKVINANIKVQLGLDATAKRRGLGQKDATASQLIHAGVCPSQIPRGMLEEYCNKDVELTERIFLQQRVELRELGLLPVAYCRNLVTPVLADIEFNGMTLDPERVEKTYSEYAEKYASVAAKFAEATGGINPKSGKQMREFIYGKLQFAEPTDRRGNPERTAGGNAKVDKATILGLKAETDEQRTFKQLATEIAKLKVPLQNLTKMKAICEANPDDPRIFATFNQTVTKTDRLSSTGRNGGFQYQNLDRAFKRLFTTRSQGSLICEADAPQLEFRVAAFLGDDATAKKDISEGFDVHQATANTLGVSRQNAKAFTFKPLFGGNSGTPREKKYYKYFRDRYNRLYRTQESWTMAVVQRKHLICPWGLRLYWPDARIQDSGYVTHTTEIFNAPIQSFATADIIPLTLVLLWHRISSLGDDAIIVNTIHDSIIAEVSPDALAEYKRILVECFTLDIYCLLDRLYGIKFDVPLGVGIKAGQFWGEGEESKHEPNK